MEFEKMYTEIEVAAILSLTVAAIRQRRARKQPPFAKKIGRAVRYPESEIAAFLAAAPTAMREEEIVRPGRKKKVTPRPPAPPSASKIASKESEILEILKQARILNVENWIIDPVGELAEILGEKYLDELVGEEVAQGIEELREEFSPTITPDCVTTEQFRTWARPYLTPERAGIAAALWARYRILNPPLTHAERQQLYNN